MSGSGTVVERIHLETGALDTFISDMDSGIECTLCKFADDTKLSSGVGPAQEWGAVQRDLDKLEDLIKFDKSKCKVLHMG
ncbi:hypothetical protein TURU_156839 [Turdus rufiventris]|nr:hypothetical protein TURU_156839 [Turdus rufiventris]